MVGEADVAAQVDACGVAGGIAVAIRNGGRGAQADQTSAQKRVLIIERSRGRRLEGVIDLGMLGQGDNAGAAHRDREDHRGCRRAGRSRRGRRAHDDPANIVKVDARAVAIEVGVDQAGDAIGSASDRQDIAQRTGRTRTVSPIRGRRARRDREHAGEVRRAHVRIRGRIDRIAVLRGQRDARFIGRNNIDRRNVVNYGNQKIQRWRT